MLKSFQMFFVAIFQHFLTCEEVDSAVQIRISFIPVTGTVIGSSIVVDDLFTALTEDVDVVISDCFCDFDIGAIHSSECQCAIQHKFHISGSGCLLGSKTDLLGKVACRNHFFCGRYIIVFNKCKLKPSGDLRIFADYLRQSQKTVDDIFCNDISRCCFGTENADKWGGRHMTGFDLQIFVNQE